MYLRTLSSSFKNLRLTLLWPYLLTLLSGAIFSGLFLFVTGLWSTLTGTELTTNSIETLATTLITQTQNNTLQIVLAFTLFFTIHFIIGSSFEAIKYKTITDIIQGKPQGIFKGFLNNWHYGRKKLLPVAFMRALIFITTSIPLALFTYFTVIRNVSPYLSGIILITIFGFFYAGLLNVYPYMFLKHYNPLKALYHSFTLFKQKTTIVLLTALTIGIAHSIQTILQLLSTQQKTLFLLLFILYTILLALWKDVYIFTTYTRNH